MYYSTPPPYSAISRTLMKFWVSTQNAARMSVCLSAVSAWEFEHTSLQTLYFWSFPNFSSETSNQKCRACKEKQGFYMWNSCPDRLDVREGNSCVSKDISCALFFPIVWRAEIPWNSANRCSDHFYHSLIYIYIVNFRRNKCTFGTLLYKMC